MIRQPLVGHPDLHVDREAFAECLQGRAKALLREGGGVQPARELAQFLECLVELLRRAREQRLERLAAGVELHAHEAQRQRQGDEPLLRAVVQVALQLAPLLVAGFDDARA